MLKDNNTDFPNKLKIHDGSLTGLVLKGISQIMLQENVWTGLLFLSGVFFGSSLMGIAMLFATISGTITAHFLKFNSSDIKKGLYGFSPALTGVAIMLFLKPTAIVWGLVVVGGILSAVLQHVFIKNKITAFTLPFVLTVWLVLFLASNYFPALLQMSDASTVVSQSDFNFAIRGYGQVIFQDKLLSGILFFIAVFINSPIAALYGLAGGILSGILSQYFSVSMESIANGLFSFNAVLCAITFGGNKVSDGIWVLTSVLLSLAISLLFVQLGLPQLTFPFVVASFIVVLIKVKTTHKIV